MRTLISIALEEYSSNGMAVPKSRRSKAKGRIRLANWKKKVEKSSKLAFNAAKTFFQKEKKELEPASTKVNANEVENSIE